MQPIVYDYEPLNEYTTPLVGEPDYTNAGVIKAIGLYGEKYSVAKIEYQHFFNEEYQYIFTPYWDVIDALDASVFQGIPGITMELRLEKYYRVNMQPVFITERSPSRKREDLWELLESVGLDYYDRFEWLIRTNLTCGNDNLIVERFREESRQMRYREAIEQFDDIQREDCIIAKNQNEISQNPIIYAERMTCLMATGACIVFEEEEWEITWENRDSIMRVLRQQYYAGKLMQIKNRQKGIDAAKSQGKYKGRKRIAIDEEQLQKTARLFHEKKISEQEAMRRLGVSSRSTFYRRMREVCAK